MTYQEILSEFKNTFKNIEINDYRPAVPMFTEGLPGITIWLKNGDILVYYPRINKNKEEN